MARLVVFFAIWSFLAGCTSWYKTGEPLPVARVERIRNAGVPQYCALPAGRWSGCAVRYAAFCVIYLTEYEVGDTLDHERRHCNGDSHN